MRSRSLYAVSAAVLAALALGACSGGSKPASAGAGATPQQPKVVNVSAIVARASTATKALKSAHISTTTELGGKTTTVEGDVSYHPTAMALDLAVAGSKLNEVLVGKTLYIKLPASAGLGQAKPWVSVSVAQMSKLTGLDLAALINQTSSEQTIELLKEAQNLKLVGTETVDGQSTQHLMGTVDIQKALAALSAQGASAQKDTLSNAVKQVGMTTAHVDVWVNAQQVPIKLTETYTSKLGNGSSTIHVTKLNQPVHVAAPQASLVQQFPTDLG